MKKIIRHWVIDSFALYIASSIAGGMVFSEGYKTLVIAGAGLTAITLFAKPVINLLLLPINMVTFGLFQWVSSAVALYLVTLLVKQFRISEFYFKGYTSQWFDIPTLKFEGLLAFIGFSFIISLITSFLYWLTK